MRCAGHKARFADLLAAARAVFGLNGQARAVGTSQVCELLVVSSVEAEQLALDVV